MAEINVRYVRLQSKERDQGQRGSAHHEDIILNIYQITAVKHDASSSRMERVANPHYTWRFQHFFLNNWRTTRQKISKDVELNTINQQDPINVEYSTQQQDTHSFQVPIEPTSR